MRDVLLAESDRACGQLLKAAEGVDEGRLAGAVRTYETEDLPGLEIDVDVVNGGKPAEDDADAACREAEPGPGSASACDGRCRTTCVH